MLASSRRFTNRMEPRKPRQLDGNQFYELVKPLPESTPREEKMRIVREARASGGVDCRTPPTSSLSHILMIPCQCGGWWDIDGGVRVHLPATHREGTL